MPDIFEQGTRLDLRFTHKGQATISDLWQLPDESLDAIYKGLMAERKVQSEDSLLKKQSAADAKTELKIAIVKHIFDTLQAERLARKTATENAKRRAELLALIDSKNQEALAGKSVEELMAEVRALETAMV